MQTAVYILAGVGVWAICTLLDAAICAVVWGLSVRRRPNGK